MRTIKSLWDNYLKLLESVQSKSKRRALVTILEESRADVASESAYLSESALAEDWNRAEEDRAWSHLQHVP